MKKLFYFIILINVLFLPVQKADCLDIYSLIGNNDSILVTDYNGKIIFSKNNSKQLVPASILKILTSLSALYYLGENYRFKTEFFLNKNNDLIIKGYGDPLLISELVTKISTKLGTIDLLKNIVINDIILDNTYFSDEPVPGALADSSEPYDAQTGALCVNFNTVNFYYDKNGKLNSAEKQTPLLPFIIKRIEETGLTRGRIILSKQEKELYPGYLFQYFLNEKGIKIKGKIKTGEKNIEEDRLIYTYHSQFTISELVAKLLEYSNNFIANQLFLAVGTKKYGAPASLSKGIKATLLYTNLLSKNNAGITNYTMIEGSGLSRENRISANAMDVILKEFKKHRHLMRKGKNELYKTGTLTGVSTRAGYISDIGKNLYRYVIMCNSPDKSSANLLQIIQASLQNTNQR